MTDLHSGGCKFKSRPGLLRTKVYSAFHPSGVGKWVPATAAAGKAKAGMAHSDCGWTCGSVGKTVKSLENTCHTWALLRWWFTAKRRYIKCIHLYVKNKQWPFSWSVVDALLSLQLQQIMKTRLSENCARKSFTLMFCSNLYINN